MSALHLALAAKRHGAIFGYDDEGHIAADLRRLPPILRKRVEARLGDVLSCVAEHSIPNSVGPAFAFDAALAILNQRAKPRVLVKKPQSGKLRPRVLR
jgi:hypothetical protein